jgi:type I restriction enzyme M protein
MNLIQEGINKGLISFDDEQKYITYIRQGKRRNYSNSEEQVQAESFLKLILVYGYDVNRVEQFVTVQIGSDKREADIIVYNNDAKTDAHIVVECKKQEVSEREFEQAVKQAFSYAATGTVRAKYFWVTSGIKDAYFEIPEKEPKKYITISDVPQFGVSQLAKFKYVKGGGVVNGQRLFDLEVVSQDELTRRFKQAHNALWGGGELNPSEAFDELDKLIFCKIWDERKPRKKGEPYDFQIFQERSEDQTNRDLQKRILALYEEGRRQDAEVFKDDVRLSVEKLRTVVGYLESVDLSKTDLDSKGRAFETFMGSFFRGDFGQYFTPRPIVKFIVDTLPIKNDSLVLDTSCGSGGFLLHALDKVRGQASDYYDEGTVEHYRYWHNFAQQNLYGIEINEQIARTAKMNMIIHDDGHTNVVAADGLLPIEDVKDEEGNISQQGIYSRTRNQGFQYGRFDFIITNPPFGSSIKLTEQAYMRQYGYALSQVNWLDPKSKETKRTNQSTEVLFIEQCHNYLKAGGYLAIVLPDGVLTNSSLQYVRDEIEEKYRIVAVVSLPQTAFQATGAGVKSSVLFLKKYSAIQTEEIRNARMALQDRLKEEYDFYIQLQMIEAQKKAHLRALTGFNNSDGLRGSALKQSEAYKVWRSEVDATYKEQVDALKEQLSEQYAEEKQSLTADYPIFMAIAEDIGYDATGKLTTTNELDYIGEELQKFILEIEAG